AGSGGASSSSGSSGSSGSGMGGAGPSASSSSVGPASSSSSGGLGGKKTLDLCSSDVECAASLVCRPLTRNGVKRCTPTCVNNTVCPTGTVCLTVDGTELCAGEDTGRACSDPTPCNYGCLTGPKYCT